MSQQAICDQLGCHKSSSFYDAWHLLIDPSQVSKCHLFLSSDPHQPLRSLLRVHSSILVKTRCFKIISHVIIFWFGWFNKNGKSPTPQIHKYMHFPHEHFMLIFVVQKIKYKLQIKIWYFILTLIWHVLDILWVCRYSKIMVDDDDDDDTGDGVFIIGA